MEGEATEVTENTVLVILKWRPGEICGQRLCLAHIGTTWISLPSQSFVYFLDIYAKVFDCCSVCSFCTILKNKM